MVAEQQQRPEARALQVLDAELERRRDVIESSAASMIDPDRMRGVLLSAFTRNPELFECDPVSVVRAVVEAAQVGLEPTGAIGGAHLVPRWNGKAKRKEAHLIIDYRGLATLARRSGEISRLTARVVREADEFAYQQGTDEWLRHIPALVPDPGPYTYVYAVAHFRDGGTQFDVMSAAQVNAHMQRFAPRNREGAIVGPWVTDPEPMWKKTVARRLANWLPLSIEVRAALAFEDEQTQEPAAQAVRVDRSARLRQNLQKRLQGGETPPEPAVADEPSSQPSSVPEESVPAQPATCEATSPYDPPSSCVREPGHAGTHRSSAKETW